MAAEESGAGFTGLVLFALLLWGAWALVKHANRQGPRPPKRAMLSKPSEAPRHPPDVASRMRYVPMAEADAKKARNTGWPMGRHNGGMTTQEFQAGRTLRTHRGEFVRSHAEVRVANELLRRGLEYEYEPEVCGYRPDFFLPAHGIIIEYWGLDEPKYNQRRRAKTATYLRNGYRLVSLGGGKEVGIERDLGRQLYYKFKETGLGPDGRPPA